MPNGRVARVEEEKHGRPQGGAKRAFAPPGNWDWEGKISGNVKSAV